MAVIMTTEVPGGDTELVDLLVSAGIPDAMGKAPGFVSHVSGVASNGFRVIEVWESPEAHQSWVENHIVPVLPPGVTPGPVEYIEVALTVPDA
jgi:hypothetical protein